MDNHGLLDAINRALDELYNETPSMDRNRPYLGQPHTDSGERGKHIVSGLTMRDIRDCYIRAYIMSHEYTPKNAPYIDEANKGEAGSLCFADVYELEGDIDPIAVAQNLCCEIERMMGIFPNVPKLYVLNDPDESGSGSL